VYAPFICGGTAHLMALAAVAVGLLLALCYPGHRTERILIAILILQWPLAQWARWNNGTLDLGNVLPLHLCDAAAVAGIISLWRRHPLAAELCYFWGLAGTVQGLITPNLQQTFPSPAFLAFFALHGGVVMAALYGVAALKLRPRAGSLRRVCAATLIFAAAVSLANAALSTNYAFLCAKPPVASLMDSLGPWPWYILSMMGLAFVLFWLLSLPFRGKAK
jgi:hypothetical integral membrane protein (TIGR02206 family)